MQTFHIDVPEADLADLRDRLARTRWPNEATAPAWDQGTPLGYLQELAATERTGPGAGRPGRERQSDCHRSSARGRF